MVRKIEEIEKDFNGLHPSDFNPSDSDAKGMEQLYKLTEELLATQDSSRIADIILKFIERLSHSAEIDPSFDLGTPGPLVHALETLPDYEESLIVSVERYPTPLTLLMINRILNVTDDVTKQNSLLKLLEKSCIHPEASEDTREEAREYLMYQQSRHS